MSVTTAVAIYFLIWWLVLFAVLPWGVRSQAEHGDISPGSDPGAPSLPRLGLKLLWTTLVSGLVFGLLYVVYTSRLVGLEDFTRLIGMPR
jgi:predicted secreted protein